MIWVENSTFCSLCSFHPALGKIIFISSEFRGVIHIFLGSLWSCRVILPQSHDGSVQPKRSGFVFTCRLLTPAKPIFAGGGRIQIMWGVFSWMIKGSTCLGKWDVWTRLVLLSSCRGTNTSQSYYLSFVFTSLLITTACVELDSKYLQIQSYWLVDEGKQGDMFTPRGAPHWGSASANMLITYHSSNALIILNKFFLPSQEIGLGLGLGFTYIGRQRCRRSYKYNKSVKKAIQITIEELCFSSSGSVNIKSAK